MITSDVRARAEEVPDQLRQQTDPEEDRFILLAGTKYREHLAPELEHVEAPMEGMRISEQSQFLTEALEDT